MTAGAEQHVGHRERDVHAVQELRGRAVGGVRRDPVRPRAADRHLQRQTDQEAEGDPDECRHARRPARRRRRRSASSRAASRRPSATRSSAPSGGSPRRGRPSRRWSSRSCGRCRPSACSSPRSARGELIADHRLVDDLRRTRGFTLDNYATCSAGGQQPADHGRRRSSTRSRSRSRRRSSRSSIALARRVRVRVDRLQGQEHAVHRWSSRCRSCRSRWRSCRCCSCSRGARSSAIPVIRGLRRSRRLHAGVDRAHDLRAAAGDLPAAQLHLGDPERGHRGGARRRRRARADLLPDRAAAHDAGDRVVRDLPVPLGLERPARGARSSPTARWRRSRSCSPR